MLPAQKIRTGNPPTHTPAQVLDPAIAADEARMDGGWGEVGETLVDVTVVVLCLTGGSDTGTKY